MAAKSKADDVRHMRRALALAERGRGRTSPNPIVGAVVVKNGRVVGEGWHRALGEPHAEAMALVEEATGRVRRTEMRIGRAPNTALARVTFRFDEALGMDVPGELKYSPFGSMEMTATYTKFRRFQVSTDEAIDPATTPPAN